MYKIFNLSNHPFDLDRFAGGSEEIREFMKKHRLDGIELIQNTTWDEAVLPADMIIGLHLRFWPVWLDFWKGDTVRLLKLFGDMRLVEHFYGGTSRSAIIKYYRSELETAKRAGARYVVFHVSNVEPEHCFSYRFTYSDEEVTDAAIELLNEVFDGFEGEFELLFENLWWPGLTLLDNTLTRKLLENVCYRHKGFMLDTSHLMNTNLELQSEEQAAEYIIDKFKGLGSLGQMVRGIHLNSSLTGKYVKSKLNSGILSKEKDFLKRYSLAYAHILNIDRHVPFEHESIRKVVETVKPEYLVYEFLTDRLDMLDRFMDMQNRALGI